MSIPTDRDLERIASLRTGWRRCYLKEIGRLLKEDRSECASPASRITAPGLLAAKGFLPGRQGAGSVHHVAFRAVDDADQAEMARKLVETHGQHPTEQEDRNYFRSVYFREPGGILFEIATDIPGFAVDEPVSSLGQVLKLPAFLESHRKDFAAVLPALDEKVA
jgi:hypothetical protein